MGADSQQAMSVTQCLHRHCCPNYIDLSTMPLTELELLVGVVGDFHLWEHHGSVGACIVGSVQVSLTL